MSIPSSLEYTDNKFKDLKSPQKRAPRSNESVVDKSRLKEEKPKRSRKKGPKYIWVNVNQAYYPLIREALESYGFKITESDTKANLFWINANGSTETASELLPYQFYNHFPGTVSISRKVDCAKNLETVSHFMPEAYSFNPETYILPLQFNDLKNHMLSIKNSLKRTFIIKPDKGSLGKGIFLIQDPNQVQDYTEPAIAQRYIDPFLIDGLKFDLRIYALITSIEPLRLYIHNEGLARFCTEPYNDPKPENLDLVYSHLTNYSLNKKNEHFHANEVVEQEEKGHKRSLEAIYEAVRKSGHDPDKLKHDIDEIIRLTIASVQHFIASQYRIGVVYNDGKSRCFEILGFDILLDKDCKPWLLEVNNKPSMGADSEFDREVKTSVIHGAMHIINLQPNFKKCVGQRIMDLSKTKSTNSTRSTTFFDPEGETLRAKETKWRQLYPLNDGDTSAIEQALAVAAQANGYKRKEKLPASASQNSVQMPQQLQASTTMQLQSPLKKRTMQKIVKPIQRTDIKPITASSPTRIIQRPIRQALPQFKVDESPMILQMKGFPPNIIIDEEEKERIKSIKQQAAISGSQTAYQRVKNMLSVVGGAPKRVDPQIPMQPIIGQSFAVRQPERAFTKSFVFRNYNLPDLVV